MTRHEEGAKGKSRGKPVERRQFRVMKGQCTEIEATQGGHDAATQTERDRERERERKRERERERERHVERERETERERERNVKYHVALLVTCACMMYTTRLQALSLPGKECMLADYICVCDN